MSAFAYMRVSTVRQSRDDRWGYDRQRAEVEKYCEANAITVDKTFRDAFTGTKSARKNLDALFEAVRPGDVVVFPSVDRLARAMSAGWYIVEALQEIGVEVHSAEMGPIDLQSDESTLRFGILATVAQAERNKIYKRTQDGLLRRAEAGKLPNGLLTYGYRTDRNGGAEIVSAQAKVVRRIFQMRAQGMGYRTIQAALNEDNVPIARPSRAKDGEGQWHWTTISRIIRNTAYKGIFVWSKDDREFHIPIPPIVTEDEWDAAQSEKRGAPSRTGWPLVGQIRCARCGHRMHAKRQHQGTNHQDYYRCESASLPDVACDAHHLPRALVEAAVEQAVRQRFSDPSAIRELLGLRVDPEPPTSAIHQLEEKRERLIYLFREGHITSAELDADMAEVTASLKALHTPTEVDEDVNALIRAAQNLPLGEFLKAARIVVIADLNEIRLQFE